MTSARYSYTTVTPSDRPLKRPHSSISTSATNSTTNPPLPSRTITDTDTDIFQSAPIHDRKSTFTAYFSPTLPPRDLQSLPALSSASHKILAWRLPPSIPESSTAPKRARQSTLTGASAPLQTGKDDDGEQHGGRHVLRVLEAGQITGSLVVARWYGGVMLGPVRFTHIEQAGRDAVAAWRAASASQKEEARSKVREEEERRGLKRLLAGLEGGTTTGGEDAKSPAQKIDYEHMTVERLRMLDKARDGTIGFLLKQIDGVE
ncbi:hypothetical protein K461DRAFT_248049, partial [Myriangium duriaei CBS 260.36]